MAKSQWWNPFSWGENNDSQDQQIAAIQNAARPFQSLTEIPVGATLNDIILKALKEQKGIGFGSEYADKTTSPLVTSREARWKQSELPSLESSLSSRGLSRSTLGARDIATASANKENDINTIIGQAYKENEAQKKVDQSKYEQMGMNFTGSEAATKAGYSADDLNRVLQQNTITQAGNTQSGQDLNQLIGSAIKYIAPAALAPMTGGASLAMYGATGLTDILDKYKKLQEAEKATTQAKPFV